MTKKALSQIADGQWQPGPEADPSQFATDAAKLMAVRQTTLIVGAALLEGAGLFGCVAFFLEGQFFVLCSPLLAAAADGTQLPDRKRGAVAEFAAPKWTSWQKCGINNKLYIATRHFKNTSTISATRSVCRAAVASTSW